MEPPYFDRTFHASETREIRLFLHGDDDRVEITGDVSSGIVVRAVGGGGDDRFQDLSTGNSHFYDHRGDNEFTPGVGTAVDESDWEEPPDQFSATHQSKARDWGSWTLGFPILSFNSDEGVYAGGGFRRDTYGFRHYPFKTRLTALGTFGPAVGRIRGSLSFDFPLFGPGVRGLLSAAGSSKEFTRFFGFGNDTERLGGDDFFRFTRDEVRLDFKVASPINESLRRSFGPTFFFTDQDETVGTLIGQLQPYGLNRFSQIGLTGSAILDRLNHPRTPRSGWSLAADGRLFPSLLAVTETFGSVRGTARWYASAEGGLRPVLALRAGGERVWGDAPYHEAAYLGGPMSVLGFRKHRFAGDAAVFGNAMVSVFLTPFYFLLPGELGLMAIAETGRVYLDGESPGGWHGSFGGGLWFSVLNPETLISLTVSRSDERTGVYFGVGWPY